MQDENKNGQDGMQNDQAQNPMPETDAPATEAPANGDATQPVAPNEDNGTEKTA